jgi:hypothetical protein
MGICFKLKNNCNTDGYLPPGFNTFFTDLFPNSTDHIPALTDLFPDSTDHIPELADLFPDSTDHIPEPMLRGHSHSWQYVVIKYLIPYLFDVWLDEEEFEPGDNVDDTMLRSG